MFFQTLDIGFVLKDDVLEQVGFIFAEIFLLRSPFAAMGPSKSLPE